MSRHARTWMLKVGAAGLAGASLLLGGTATVAQAATPVATAEAEKFCEGRGTTPVSRDAAEAAGYYAASLEEFADSEYFQCGDGGIVQVRTVDGVAYAYLSFVYPRGSLADLPESPQLPEVGNDVAEFRPF